MIIGKNCRNNNFISTGITFTKLKPLFTKVTYVNSEYKYDALSDIKDEIIECIKNTSEKCKGINEISFKIPYELKAQTDFERDYGWEYEGDYLVKEGSNYGDTRRFYILGITFAIHNLSSSNPLYLIDETEPTQGIFEVLNTKLAGNKAIKQIIRNIDFKSKHIKDIETGDLGEQIVLEYEKDILRKAEKFELMEKVSFTRDTLGNAAPYDILSFTPNGTKKYIEVKSTEGAFNNPFYISANELEFARANNDNYYLYRIYNMDKVSKTANFIIRNNICDTCIFEPNQYSVTLR